MDEDERNAEEEVANGEPDIVDVAVATARTLVVGVVGITVVLVGVAMLVLPGPAFVVIPAGLGILALEFAWARRWLRRLREYLRLAQQQVSGKKADEAGKEES